MISSTLLDLALYPPKVLIEQSFVTMLNKVNFILSLTVLPCPALSHNMNLSIPFPTKVRKRKRKNEEKRKERNKER